MRRAISVSLGLLITFTATTVLASGVLKLEFTGMSPETLKHVRVEVLESDGKKVKVTSRSDATKIPHKGLSLPAGNYQVYLEDKETGLIVPLEVTGVGYKVQEQGVAHADAGDYVRMVREIKEKDKAERRLKGERLKRHKVKKAVFAIGGESAAAEQATVGQNSGQEQDYAPGELFIKYQPDTTLAERYRFIQELKAENRSKLDQIDVYRVKVSEATDLQATVQRFAGDPRLKYMEMNMVVSVPEPVGEGSLGK